MILKKKVEKNYPVLKRIILGMAIILFIFTCSGEPQKKSAFTQNDIDAFITENEIPALAMAVFSKEKFFETYYSGTHKAGSLKSITAENCFHLGSNTKAFVGFVAAKLVEENVIEWDSKFFDMFPEYKNVALSEYHNITLEQLLRHQAGTVSKEQEGAELLQAFYLGASKPLTRDSLFTWALKKPRAQKNFNYSNTGYTMAAHMLEKAGGRSWKTLVNEIVLKPLEISCGFGWPAEKDTNQTWGHYRHPANNQLFPHPPNDLYKLKSTGLDPAGDMYMTLPDYLVFLQENLKGINGESKLLTKSTYKKIHSGEEYGIGWGIIPNMADRKNVSAHSGSAGTFFCQAFLFTDYNLGIAILTNSYPRKPGCFNLLINKILENY
jgi:CubicO group peptidase (beta-lactamase class C family)